MRLHFEDCVVDLGARQVFRSQRQIRLSPKAFQTLELLAGCRPNALSKEEILQRLWPDVVVADGSLANVVSELREALGDDARSPRIVRTVQRYGYAFEARVEVEGRETSVDRPSVAGCRLLWGEREIALVEGENLIGRDPGGAVFVDDVSVSRHHARIVAEGSLARIEDLGSKNGTYLRGEKLETATILRDGDAIRLGSVAMVIHRSEAGPSTETVSRR